MPKGMKCFNCNKGIMHGHNVSHSKRRTPRIFKPNLHWAKIKVNGGNRRVRLCTKCLRRAKEEGKIKERKPKLLREKPLLEKSLLPAIF